MAPPRRSVGEMQRVRRHLPTRASELDRVVRDLKRAGWPRQRQGTLLFLAVMVAVLLGFLVSDDPASSPYTRWTPSRESPEPITNMPPQAASIVYGDPSHALPYARPGGLVVAGRDNFGARAFTKVSAAGGTVLIYLDAVINNSHGRYHYLLMEDSLCGPATSLWPSAGRANQWGYLNDFRVGSILQKKLPCVLEKMVLENPHMAGWFADDIGSRSWFPEIAWNTWSTRQKQAYRAGAIALVRTFRTVADRHGLIIIVNGTWGAGTLSSAGGGYPDMDQHGNALADGGFVEYHDGQIAYFGPYACSSQWATDSPVTNGKAFNYAVTRTASGLREYRDSHCFSYVNHQPDYHGAPPRWGTSHPTGLPSRVSPE
jgi:hypothetical protein